MAKCIVCGKTFTKFLIEHYKYPDGLVCADCDKKRKLEGWREKHNQKKLEEEGRRKIRVDCGGCVDCGKPISRFSSSCHRYPEGFTCKECHEKRQVNLSIELEKRNVQLEAIAKKRYILIL